MKKSVFLAALAAMAVCSAATVFAGPSLVIMWEDGNGQNGQVAIGSEALLNGATKSGTCNVKISIGCASGLLKGTDADGLFGLSNLTFEYDEDPFVMGAFSIINSTAVTQTYTFIFTSPVFPALTPSTLYGGSMSGSISADGTPATVTTVSGIPLYWGMIDGTPVLPIYSDPQSWGAVAFGSGQIPAVNVPTTNPGPAALNNLSLQFKFTLTPGDVATMNGIFEVLIPEPATLVMLGFGGLGLFFKRK